MSTPTRNPKNRNRSRLRPGCDRCDGTGWVWLHGSAPDGTVRMVEASCPSCCGPSVERVLDWRAAHHWSSRRAACRHCGNPTNLRGEDGVPSHKVCAEHALAAEEATRNAERDDTVAAGLGEGVDR